MQEFHSQKVPKSDNLENDLTKIMALGKYPSENVNLKKIWTFLYRNQRLNVRLK